MKLQWELYLLPTPYQLKFAPHLDIDSFKSMKWYKLNLGLWFVSIKLHWIKLAWFIRFTKKLSLCDLETIFYYKKFLIKKSRFIVLPEMYWSCSQSFEIIIQNRSKLCLLIRGRRVLAVLIFYSVPNDSFKQRLNTYFYSFVFFICI